SVPRYRDSKARARSSPSSSRRRASAASVQSGVRSHRTPAARRAGGAASVVVIGPLADADTTISDGSGSPREEPLHGILGEGGLAGVADDGRTLGAVEVGASGGDQPQPAGQPSVGAALVRRVLGAMHLDAAQ